MNLKDYVKYFFLDYLHVDKEYYQNSQLEENLRINFEKKESDKNLTKVLFNAEDSYYGQLRTVFNKFHYNKLEMTLTIYQNNIQQRIRIWRIKDKRPIEEIGKEIIPKKDFIPLEYYLNLDKYKSKSQIKKEE